MVRRTAVDAAAGTGDAGLRPLFEEALTVTDAWVRWKAVRALGELGVGPSRDAVAALRSDPTSRCGSRSSGSCAPADGPHGRDRVLVTPAPVRCPT